MDHGDGLREMSEATECSHVGLGWVLEGSKRGVRNLDAFRKWPFLALGSP